MASLIPRLFCESRMFVKENPDRKNSYQLPNTQAELIIKSFNVTEADLGFCQTSMMEFFPQIANGF